MSTFDRAALVKALETLGSAEAHQALAAAKLATSLLRDAGLGWNDVLQAEIRPRIAGSGPFGYRREQRELSPHEQFFMVLLSPRTPIEVKRALRGWEARVLDGEITPQESQELGSLYRNYVA
ncbi:MAG: hypothetical protein J0J01_12265 [Reyranella sp.]|uniref:hypothetical protein n=2 Tax=Bacteria TaxID=2 RepID=UPI001ACF44FB|nr:hypothetical protein [Reyranella sp.]MBN9087675.1 hypothetical protein [Reyranella sp.]